MADGRKIARLLLKHYPEPKVALEFGNALELLIATILSAQCTDARVNEVTRSLFKKYRRAEDYVQAHPATLEKEIRSTGFYRSKAKKVRECCRKLVEAFGGKVPKDVDALTTLPGVGRKTANIVLGNAFAQQAIAVDTHVLRVSSRLGLASSKNADKVEQALMEQIPEDKWTAFTNALILHGRETCTARNPQCGRCVLYPECEWPEKRGRTEVTA
jgi:endonuclease-3